MKSSHLLAAGLLSLALTTAPGQTPTPTLRPPASEQNLTRFDLDFPGGTPKDLVGAIQKSMARPLNAIVPDELVNERLPALRMKNISVAQLFEALGVASHRNEKIPTGFPGQFQIMSATYGFRTQGPPTDDSIWFFYSERPQPPAITPPQKICRFYSLAPYLENGTTVDDITTAIETGWKMLGDESPAAIRFHKDTKLLIAVGEPSKLEIIDAALKALDVPKTKSVASLPPATKRPDKPRTDE